MSRLRENSNFENFQSENSKMRDLKIDEVLGKCRDTQMKTTTIAMLQNLYSIPLPLLFDREMEPHKLTIY